MPRSWRGDAEAAGARARDTDRGVSRALLAEDGEADRGRLPARLGRRSGARRVRQRPSESRSRSPTTSSTAPGRRRRPGRSPAPTCAREHRPCRSSMRPSRTSVVRAALAGGSLDGALVRVAATDALGRSRRAALDYAAAREVVPRLACSSGGVGSVDVRRGGPRRMTEETPLIKLGRIGYVNMAPVFFRLGADVEEVVGVPDRSQPPPGRTASSTSRRSRRSSTRATPTR